MREKREKKELGKMREKFVRERSAAHCVNVIIFNVQLTTSHMGLFGGF